MFSHDQIQQEQKSCAQREKKWIEARLVEDKDNGEASEPSEGQVFVIDKITGEKPWVETWLKQRSSGLPSNMRWVDRWILIDANRIRAVEEEMSNADRPWLSLPFRFGRTF